MYDLPDPDSPANTVTFPNGIAYHDWWLAVCAANENKIIYTPKSLIKYRQHSEQFTGTSSHKKVSIFSLSYSNIMHRWNNVEFNRFIGAQRHLQNLHAFKNTPNCFNRSETLLNDVILYFEDYLNNRLHFKTFFISLKYRKILYPHKNYLFLKNILMDIIG